MRGGDAGADLGGRGGGHSSRPSAAMASWKQKCRSKMVAHPFTPPLSQKGSCLSSSTPTNDACDFENEFFLFADRLVLSHADAFRNVSVICFQRRNSAARTLTLTVPCTFSISPSIADSSDVFPEPTCPTTAINAPSFTVRSMLRNTGINQTTRSSNCDHKLETQTPTPRSQHFKFGKVVNTGTEPRTQLQRVTSFPEDNAPPISQ